MHKLSERSEDLIRSVPLLILLFGDEACAPCHALENRLDSWVAAHPEAEAAKEKKAREEWQALVSQAEGNSP